MPLEPRDYPHDVIVKPFDKELFNTIVEEFVGSDCWGVSVVVDNQVEVVYEDYHPKSVRDECINGAIRSQLIKNPWANTLCNYYRRNQPATLIIHMFGVDGYDIHVSVDRDTNTMTLQQFDSRALHEQNFENELLEYA